MLEHHASRHISGQEVILGDISNDLTPQTLRVHQWVPILILPQLQKESIVFTRKILSGYWIKSAKTQNLKTSLLA